MLMSLYERDDPHLLDTALRSIFDQERPEETEVRLYLGIDGPVGPALLEVVERHRER
ncbi:hypothetical protein GY655_26290, partial [Escherichia coli]|nr:hypothetical protein [Escherichia coli]